MSDKYKKAAELLLKGATMLSIACPKCHDPLYMLKDGTMFCVSCNKKVIYEQEFNNLPKNEVNNIIDNKIIDDPILNKINQLGEKLKNTEDPNEIITLAQLIRKLQKIRES